MRMVALEILASALRPEGASDEALSGVEAALHVELPRSYRSFMMTSNGCDGAAGEAWCILYPIEQVIELTKTYREATFTDGVIFIGTDGGGEAFIIDFNTSLPTFASMAYIGDGLEDALHRDETLDGFIAKLANP